MIDYTFLNYSILQFICLKTMIEIWIPSRPYYSHVNQFILLGIYRYRFNKSLYLVLWLVYTIIVNINKQIKVEEHRIKLTSTSAWPLRMSYATTAIAFSEPRNIPWVTWYSMCPAQSQTQRVPMLSTSTVAMSIPGVGTYGSVDSADSFPLCLLATTSAFWSIDNSWELDIVQEIENNNHWVTINCYKIQEIEEYCWKIWSLELITCQPPQKVSLRQTWNIHQVHLTLWSHSTYIGWSQDRCVLGGGGRRQDSGSEIIFHKKSIGLHVILYPHLLKFWWLDMFYSISLWFIICRGSKMNPSLNVIYWIYFNN